MQSDLKDLVAIYVRARADHKRAEDAYEEHSQKRSELKRAKEMAGQVASGLLSAIRAIPGGDKAVADAIDPREPIPELQMSEADEAGNRSVFPF